MEICNLYRLQCSLREDSKLMVYKNSRDIKKPEIQNFLKDIMSDCTLKDALFAITSKEIATKKSSYMDNMKLNWKTDNEIEIIIEKPTSFIYDINMALGFQKEKSTHNKRKNQIQS